MQTTTLAQNRYAAERSPRRRGAALVTWQARRVTRHVEEHLDDRLTIGDLAKLVGLGRSRFSAAFRRSFSQAPYSYLLQCRVRRACELMAMTQEPLSQIAVLCGFADQSHLTRVFRARVGVPPNAWRRSDHGDGAMAESSCRGIVDSCLPPSLQDLVEVRCRFPDLRSEDGEAVRQAGIGLRTSRPYRHGLLHL